MDIIHLGHACFKIKGKNAIVVTDPFSPEFTGLKFPKTEAEIVTVSHQHEDHNGISNFKFQISNEPLIISGPGEYESRGVKILGVSSFHDDQKGAERGRNTIYKLNIDGINLCHLGDLGHKLESQQIEVLAGVDILMIPVGNKYTLSAKLAVEVVAQLEPKIVIPMHYAVSGLKITGLAGVEDFLKEMGKPDVKPQPKLTISKDKLPAEMEIIVLE